MNLLDKFSYYIDFVVVPVIVLLIIAFSNITLAWAGYCIFGFVLWTWFEYIVHLLAHHLPILKEAHEVHHQHPTAYSGPSSMWSAAFYIALGTLLSWVFGASVAFSLLAGFLIGYAIFLFVHDATHRRTIEPGHFLYKAKMRHIAHHKFDNINFGVITTVWDRIFRTYRD